MSDDYEENYRVLCIAIVTQVIEEYKNALRRNNKYKIQYCEKWLRSDWCFLLSGMDGEYLIKSVRKVVHDEERDRGYDGERIKKVYKTTHPKSKHKNKEYRKKKKSI